MPLCGTKKSKKQKRDPSPPYTGRASIEDKEIANKELKSLKDEKAQLAEELKQEKNQKRMLIEQVQSLEKRLKENVEVNKDKPDAAISIPETSGEEIKEYQTQLKDMQRQIEEEQKKRKAVEEEKHNLEEDLKQAKKLKVEDEDVEKHNTKIEDDLSKANKALETERTHREKVEEEKEKYKRDKDAIENTLALTKKELEIAKKESHIPRSPTRAPSEEWKTKIQTAETELKKEREQRMDKERDLSRIHSENEELIKEKTDLQQQVDTIQSDLEDALSNNKKNLENTEKSYKNDMNRLEEIIDDLKAKLVDEGAAKETLLTRLSAATAARVLDGNPNVSDLSDPNRPQKLGEQMGQLYDDQWTDASELLDAFETNENTIIKTLLDLMTTVYGHCKESAENQLSRIEEDIFLPPMESQAPPLSPDSNGTEPVKSPTSSKHSMSRIPRFTSHKGRPALPNMSSEKKTIDTESNDKEKDKSKRSLSFHRMKGEKLPEIPAEVRKGVKEYRKQITKQVTPVIEKEIMNKLRENPEFGDKIVDACNKYISRCVELCWLMRVQDPPVALSWSIPEDRSFDSDVYRAYTKNGTHIEFMVWPTMYLYEGGPVLMKGVAQGIKE